jgi:MarR family transcriptional regulator, organic hydroperoxide resistance regulator
MSRPASRQKLREHLAHAVRQAFASVILFNQKVADDVGINLRDLQVLHLLVLHGPSTPRDLARWACVTTGGMTVVLDRLERDGYLRRRDNPADRRSCIVQLIPGSLHKLESIYASKAKLLDAAIGQYRDADLRLLIRFFDQLNGEEIDRAGKRRSTH